MTSFLVVPDGADRAFLSEASNPDEALAAVDRTLAGDIQEGDRVSDIAGDAVAPIRANTIRQVNAGSAKTPRLYHVAVVVATADVMRVGELATAGPTATDHPELAV